MTKLHEILAVEKDREGVFKRIFEEGIVTFSKKSDHFLGMHKNLQWFIDDPPPDTPEEHKEMVTTVGKKLDYVFESFIKVTDIVLQKELTNQEAKADVIIDGVTLFDQVPATFLLGMETRLKQVRALFDSIPTLQPGIEWEKDPDAGVGIYKAKHPEKTYKTKDEIVPMILYEATKEHPAQVREMKDVKNVGMYTTVRQSGMITPSDKSDLLERCDKLMEAVKKARTRANEQKVVKRNVGKTIVDYLLNKDNKFGTDSASDSNSAE